MGRVGSGSHAVNITEQFCFQKHLQLAFLRNWRAGCAQQTWPAAAPSWPCPNRARSWATPGDLPPSAAPHAPCSDCLGAKLPNTGTELIHASISLPCIFPSASLFNNLSPALARSALCRFLAWAPHYGIWAPLSHAWSDVTDAWLRDLFSFSILSQEGELALLCCGFVVFWWCFSLWDLAVAERLGVSPTIFILLSPKCALLTCWRLSQFLCYLCTAFLWYQGYLVLSCIMTKAIRQYSFFSFWVQVSP